MVLFQIINLNLDLPISETDNDDADTENYSFILSNVYSFY